MSAHPEKLSTADMAAAAQPRTDQPEGVDMPANVRRLERPNRAPSPAGRPASLFEEQEANDLRRRWEELQIGFVDEPRHAVEGADSLVAQTLKRVAEVFARERSQLEEQWSKSENVSTEDLRVALTRYRAFFDRLLTV
jgi:hypothetical protein